VSQSPIDLGYRARPQFQAFHARKQRWAIGVAHVRAGKTVASIMDLIDAAIRCKLPNPRFAYIAPYFGQAKDVAWTYLKHYTAPIPGVKANETDCFVDLPGGRRVRLYGADNYKRIAGTYLDGAVLDEFGDMDPRAWQEVIRARLSDRRGWAAFIGTPQGINHFKEKWDEAQGNPDWFVLRLRASETGILPEDELADARKAMSEEQYQAQYEASFEASVVGAYWGREMAAAEQAGRIARVPHQPEIGVETWWDLGVSDAMTIWFTQTVGREVHVIDYYENSGEGLPHYARLLQDKGYVYASHHAPHDIAVRELGTGRSRLESAAALGIRFETVPNIPRQDGIDAVRGFLARCWFDREGTQAGRLALISYRKTWDEKRKVFSTAPFHNWASNGADAFRYLAVGHKISAARPREATRAYQQTGSGQGWMGA
jgi:hypothetical protein